MEGSWLVIGVGLLGLFVGATGAFAFRLSERAQRTPPKDHVGLAVDDDVAGLLSALRSTSVLLGAGDEVLRATPDAYTSGLVRNGHVTYEPLNQLISEVRRTGDSRDDHMLIPRSTVPGADRLAFAVRAAPLTAGRVLLLADDRTAERRVEEIRRDFVANVSHELKTPVGAIALLAETVTDAADDPEAVRRFTARMQREVRRLSVLVQEIIDLSRLQAPETEVDFVDVRLDVVVAEAVDRVRVEAQSRQVQIAVGGAHGLHVFGDHGLLVTAVRNLLDNALRYSPSGTRVSVGLRSRDGIVEIAVVDQGVGITTADASRVFERFYRVDPARSRETGGTGLGLSIVKHVASNHGGEVTLWSTPGRGSTFTLRIPEAESITAGPDGVPRTTSDPALPGAKGEQA